MTMADPMTLRDALGEDMTALAARLTPARLAARVTVERVAAHSALDSAALNALAIATHVEALRNAHPELGTDLDAILEIVQAIVDGVDDLPSNLPQVA